LLENREQLRVQASTDALTGVLNRRAILQTLEEEIARAEAEYEDVAVGMMDIDMFKSINDTFGHAAGDEVLKEVVRRSADSVRSNDFFGRFGGEEFLLVLPGVNSEATHPILERVRNAVRSSAVQVRGRQVRVTVSIGGVVRDGESIDDLIRAADDALYAAKAAGRDKVVMSRAAVSFPTAMARERKPA
jgi:diguanylate cyclase (GGDEF)-like protein